MRRLQVFHRMKQLSAVQVKHQRLGVLFRRGEEPLAFQVRREMVEVAIFQRGERHRLDQLQRLLFLGESAEGEECKNYKQKNRVPFLHECKPPNQSKNDFRNGRALELETLPRP